MSKVVVQTRFFSSNFQIEDEVNDAFSCNFCEKVCKSKRGLSRHITCKHKDKGKDEAGTSSHEQKPVETEKKLHPLQLKSMIKKSIAKLVSEGCYPALILNEMESYQFEMDDVLFAYEKCKQIIDAFNGNAEKFLPCFYKCVSDGQGLFQRLSKYPSLLVGFELANQVLAHLNDANNPKSMSSKFFDVSVLTEKEKACIAYLSGYVFGTYYRRIRRSKQWNTALSQQYLSLLMAGKTSDSAEQNGKSLIAAKNRGGLWTVSNDAIQIFIHVEAQFRTETSSLQKKISCGDMVTILLGNCHVLALLSKIRSISEQEVSKEISVNLLEKLITLYIRVRSFSYARDQMQKHKIQIQKGRTKSLRTDIKRKSSSLDKGK